MHGNGAVQHLEAVQASQLWRSTKEVSADIHACVDCEVHYRRSVPYSCSTGHSHVASPDGSKCFTARCESTGLFSGVKNCTVIVCDTPQERKNGTFVEPDLEPTFRHVVSYKVSLWLLGERDAEW